MNYLKKFESFQTHDEIYEICKKYNITNYTINEDGSIDVDDDVNLREKSLKKLPLKFNYVSGNFDCSENILTTLEGAPVSVYGDFWCSENNLDTLENAPESVYGNFYCYDNKLVTLEGAPQYVGGLFDCSENNLTTLEGAPQYVGGNFYCYKNKLTTLEGAPQSVGGHFNCSFNRELKSLKYLPEYVTSEEVDFRYTAVYEIFKLFGDYSTSMIRCVNDFKVVVDDKIDIEILNALLYDHGKSPVENVKGYINI